MPSVIDCIIHVAAVMGKDLSNSELFNINTLGTFHLLEYGKEAGITRFIFASSGGVYGYSSLLLSEHAPINPLDFYGLTKYQAELLVNYHGRDFITTVLRLFFPYGAGQQNGIVPLLASRIKNREQIIIYNDDSPRISLTHINDVVRAFTASLSTKDHLILNICGDEHVSIKELALLMSSYIGIYPVFEYKVNKSILNLICDNALMKNNLGVTPNVSLEDGIARYIKDLGSE